MKTVRPSTYVFSRTSAWYAGLPLEPVCTVFGRTWNEACGHIESTMPISSVHTSGGGGGCGGGGGGDSGDGGGGGGEAPLTQHSWAIAQEGEGECKLHLRLPSSKLALAPAGGSVALDFDPGDAIISETAAEP